MSDLLDPFVLGPWNGGVLVVSSVVSTLMVARSLSRLHRGELVEALPLVAVLVMPLAFAVFSANVLLPWDVEAAASHPDVRARQTLWAIALHRSILTQLYGGLVVAVQVLGLIGGALWLTVPGERPRQALGQIGALAGTCFFFVVAVGLALEPSGVLAARTGLYGMAVLWVVSALLAAHRRGPGVQLAVISAIAFPLLVAAVDQATLAWITGGRLIEVARAAASDKAALMEATLTSLDTMRSFSGLHLGLACGLALLGPVAAWRVERPLARQHLAALATIVVVGATGVGYASTWLAGF